MINAYDLFPDPTERAEVKEIVDLFNGKIVSITTKENYDKQIRSNEKVLGGKEEKGTENQRREGGFEEKCIFKTDVPRFNAYAGRESKGYRLTFRTVEKHV